MIYVGFYFLLGLVSLLLLEATTKRISTRLRGASYDTSDTLAQGGMPVGTRTALVITIFMLVVFWPFAVAPAVIGYFRRKRG